MFYKNQPEIDFDILCFMSIEKAATRIHLTDFKRSFCYAVICFYHTGIDNTEPSCCKFCCLLLQQHGIMINYVVILCLLTKINIFLGCSKQDDNELGISNNQRRLHRIKQQLKAIQRRIANSAMFYEFISIAYKCGARESYQKLIIIIFKSLHITYRSTSRNRIVIAIIICWSKLYHIWNVFTTTHCYKIVTVNMYRIIHIQWVWKTFVGRWHYTILNTMFYVAMPYLKMDLLQLRKIWKYNPDDYPDDYSHLDVMSEVHN